MGRGGGGGGVGWDGLRDLCGNCMVQFPVGMLKCLRRTHWMLIRPRAEKILMGVVDPAGADPMGLLYNCVDFRTKLRLERYQIG